jgi:hypothetical protein
MPPINSALKEEVRTSKTSVNFNVTTRRYILKDCKLHTRCRESLKSHKGYKRLTTSSTRKPTAYVCPQNLTISEGINAVL